jgi:hypothetical protein
VAREHRLVGEDAVDADQPGVRLRHGLAGDDRAPRGVRTPTVAEQAAAQEVATEEIATEQVTQQVTVLGPSAEQIAEQLVFARVAGTSAEQVAEQLVLAGLIVGFVP